jgi:hypothetical protein
MTMIDTHYFSNYVQRSLNQDTLEPPDPVKAKENYEPLVSIYEAHQRGGIAAAKISWETIKHLRPNLFHLEQLQLKLIHADELINLDPPIYISSYYPIYQNGFNLIAGPSGCGKSFIGQDVAGRVARLVPVVYIAGEGLHGFAARWEAWKAHNNCPTAQLYFYREALQVLNPSELQEFIELVKGHNPALVVIDTLARSAVGLEENSAKEMGQFIGACDLVRNALNTTILVIHHDGSNGKIRGSTALYAAADSVIAVKSEGGIISLYNDLKNGGKNKFAEPMPVRHLRLIPYPVRDLDGAVLIEAEQVIQGKEDKLSQGQQDILDFLKSFSEGQPAKVISEATGIESRTVYRYLTTLTDLDYIIHDEKTAKYKLRT